MASAPIYQLYAELDEYRPKIWRRFQVLNTISMARLGYILMTMFEMQASHLFSFDVPYGENIKKQINLGLAERGSPDDYKDPAFELLFKRTYHVEIFDEYTHDLPPREHEKVYNAPEIKLKSCLSSPEDILNFAYDFGDNWNVEVKVEKIFEDKDLPGKELPRVLDGEGYGIIEDCGGTYGLEQIAEAFKTKKGEQY